MATDKNSNANGANHAGNIGRTTFWFGCLSVASVGMVILNKLVSHHFPLPMTLLMYQNTLSVFITLLAAQIGWVDMKPWKVEHLQQFIVPSILFSIFLGASIRAMPYVAVGTIVVNKCLGTLLVSVGDRVVFGQELNGGRLRALYVILAGSCIYWYTDGNYNPIGYFWLGVNCLANAMSNLYEKHVVMSIDQTAAGSACYLNILSLPVLLFVAMTTGEIDRIAPAIAELTPGVEAALLFTGCLGFLISLAYTTLYTIATTTSVMVASTANKLVSVALGQLMFANKFNALSFTGLMVSLYGAWMYANEKSKARAIQTTESIADVEKGSATALELKAQQSE